MALEVVPFAADRHLDVAASLLAARHRRDRAEQPSLPARFEQPAAVRPFLLAAIESGAAGAVALLDGRPVGYLLGSIQLPAPTSEHAVSASARSVRIATSAHAADSTDMRAVYASLYRSLAPTWLARGCFDHVVEVSAGDVAVVDAWFSLGFGCRRVVGLRDTAPGVAVPRPRSANVEIHQAGTEDLESVFALVTALYRCHAGAPIFEPYLEEVEPALRELQRESLADPGEQSWLAYRNGRALGLQVYRSLRTGRFLLDEATCCYLSFGFTDAAARGSGIGSALLERGMERARDHGFTSCAVSWASANPSACGFWPACGFEPTIYAVTRHVDERIMWATGR